ncbi:MAG: alpha/beta hydrolase [Burkholderiales bacterium]|jgi:pimeloyl-ACP methyl ester carboxylesterase|nr:alpha/beta hydrolase [Burkholderiales bacterium]
MTVRPEPGTTRTIVFSHANGFPAGTYRRLFDCWREAGWRVVAPPKFGHDPRYPVTSNWPHLRDQLLHFIDAEAAGPAYLVGHSLGGYLSLLAAVRRPDVARGVVLLDSPVLPNWMGRTVQFAKATGIGERFSPGHVSKRRREFWPNLAAARTHFASKAAFARWADGVLDDYLSCGLEVGAQGQQLSFARMIETSIYNTLPHHLARLLRRHPLRCPAAFVGGNDSEELRRVGLREVKRLTHSRITMLDGTHLFPLEQPQATASAVLHWLASFAACRPSHAPA